MSPNYAISVSKSLVSGGKLCLCVCVWIRITLVWSYWGGLRTSRMRCPLFPICCLILQKITLAHEAIGHISQSHGYQSVCHKLCHKRLPPNWTELMPELALAQALGKKQTGKARGLSPILGPNRCVLSIGPSWKSNCNQLFIDD